jgi:hypothetical protein
VKKAFGQLLLQAVTQQSACYCQVIMMIAMTGYQAEKFIFQAQT